MMTLSFFLAMDPPTATHQEKSIRIVNGKPVVYEPANLKAARAKLIAHLAKHRPEKKIDGPISLKVKWCFRGSGGKVCWKITKPDTDNLEKMLKDCMTRLGYWNDDAQVCREMVEKFWNGDMPGIYISISQLEGEYK